MSPLTDDMTKQEVIEELARVLAKIIRREVAKKKQIQNTLLVLKKKGPLIIKETQTLIIILEKQLRKLKWKITKFRY